MNEIEKPKSKRLIFIDVLRGIAVIWMIETHGLRVLAAEFKSGSFYNLLNISNGFVAVVFLFCAGAGFWLASERKIQDYKQFKQPLWIYLRRLGFILIAAYFIHAPVFSFSKCFSLTEAQITYFFQIDVLQAIVYSSLTALLILIISPKRTYFKYISLILSIIIFLLTPAIWSINVFEKVPFFFAFLVAAPPVSKFPLLPWAGFFFAGIAITAFFMESKNKDKIAKIFIIISFIIPILIFVFRSFDFGYLAGDQFWRTNPLHSLFRVCGAVFGFMSLYLLERYYSTTKFINILVISGRESLFLYLSHLMIIYGSVINMGLRFYGLVNLNPYQSALLIAAIISVCISMAIGWHLLKRNYPKQSKYFIYGMGVFLFILFFISK